MLCFPSPLWGEGGRWPGDVRLALALPPRRRSLLGDLRALLRREAVCPGLATLQSTKPSQGHSRRVFVFRGHAELDSALANNRSSRHLKLSVAG